MDGVVTKTAVVHEAAWKKSFDDLLKSRSGDKFAPFTEEDYLKYVDCKKREDGVRSFLQSRKIELPDGTPHDKPGFESVYALGNLKNKTFLDLLRSRGVESYESTVGLIRALKDQGIKTAIVTASKNGNEILKVTNLGHVFDVKVDGVVAERLKLKGKPSPDTYLAAAEKLGVPPQRAVVVEDAASGVEAGRNGHFGLVIGVARSNNVGMLRDHGADVVVHDLAEVRVSGERKSRGTAWSDLEVTDQNWVLTYNDFVPESEGEREAICAVGNGYFCTRAAAPESIADDVHYPATYLSGGYNRIRISQGGAGFEQEDLVNMPNWLFFTFKIEDGDWFDPRKVEILKYQQRLDLRSGVVRRSIQFRDAQGRVSTYSQCWFVHM
ncbi:MAG: HAD-IA family hydrolase, partial [Candidatus Saccharimonadales bacterium]